MPRLKYASRVQVDLARLFDFLADKDIGPAIRAMRAIHDTASTLTYMPEIGRPVGDGLRELVIDFGGSGYLALYEFDHQREEVVIFALRHQLEQDYR